MSWLDSRSYLITDQLIRPNLGPPEGKSTSFILHSCRYLPFFSLGAAYKAISPLLLLSFPFSIKQICLSPHAFPPNLLAYLTMLTSAISIASIAAMASAASIAPRQVGIRLIRHRRESEAHVLYIFSQTRDVGIVGFSNPALRGYNSEASDVQPCGGYKLMGRTDYPISAFASNSTRLRADGLPTRRRADLLRSAEGRC